MTKLMIPTAANISPFERDKTAHEELSLNKKADIKLVAWVAIVAKRLISLQDYTDC